MSEFLDTVLQQSTAAGLRAYERNKVPAVPTYPYLVVSVVLGRPGGYTLDAAHGLRFGSIVAQCFGHTETGISDYLETFLGLFLDRRLSIAGWDCGPCQMEQDPVSTDDPDDSGIVGLIATLSFTATPLIAQEA